TPPGAIVNSMRSVSDFGSTISSSAHTIETSLPEQLNGCCGSTMRNSRRSLRCGASNGIVCTMPTFCVPLPLVYQNSRSSADRGSTSTLHDTRPASVSPGENVRRPLSMSIRRSAMGWSLPDRAASDCACAELPRTHQEIERFVHIGPQADLALHLQR